jgi:hypothetical protein
VSPTLSIITRWRLLVLLTAATASALIAGCCGGPLSADGECSGCDCDDDAGTPAPMDAASDAGDAAGDASDDAADDAG